MQSVWSTQTKKFKMCSEQNVGEKKSYWQVDNAKEIWISYTGSGVNVFRISSPIVCVGDGYNAEDFGQINVLF